MLHVVSTLCRTVLIAYNSLYDPHRQPGLISSYPNRRHWRFSLSLGVDILHTFSGYHGDTLEAIRGRKLPVVINE